MVILFFRKRQQNLRDSFKEFGSYISYMFTVVAGHAARCLLRDVLLSNVIRDSPIKGANHRHLYACFPPQNLCSLFTVAQSIFSLKSAERDCPRSDSLFIQNYVNQSIYCAVPRRYSV